MRLMQSNPLSDYNYHQPAPHHTNEKKRLIRNACKQYTTGFLPKSYQQKEAVIKKNREEYETVLIQQFKI